MLIRFFLMLRAAGVPVTVTEFLVMLEALQEGAVPFAWNAKTTVPLAASIGAIRTFPSDNLSAVEKFYFLTRAILVKDERHSDRYDRVFAAHFRGAEIAFEAM